RDAPFPELRRRWNSCRRSRGSRLLGRGSAAALARRKPRPRIVRARGPGRNGPADARTQLRGHLSLGDSKRPEPPREEEVTGPAVRLPCRRAFPVRSTNPMRWLTGEMTMARAWHLKSRPSGMPTHENFELKDIELPPVAEGLVRIRNHWLSVDPYMRGRMNDVKSYVPPFQLGEPMDGGAIGEVVESKADGFAVGDLVQHMAGWRDEAVIDARTANKLPNLGASPDLYLGVLGVTGMTAYFGLLDAASAKAGDIVFVSAAAGAVGSVAVQIAKAKGMTVIGSAGGPEKCNFVRSLGAD